MAILTALFGFPPPKVKLEADSTSRQTTSVSLAKLVYCQ